MKTRARVVFFDLGETLVTQNIEDNLVTKRALDELTKNLPKHVSGEKLYRIYQKGFRANHAMRSRTHVEIPVQVWMRELLTEALNDDPDDKLVDCAIGIIVKNRASNSVAFKDARPLLDKLTIRGVRLGIVSNVSSHEVALQILKHVRLDGYFEHIITSAYTGIRKPDPGIFLCALNQFGAKPSQAIHVGDSEVHDVWGAKPVGITTVLVKGGKDIVTDADFCFRSLGEAADTIVKLAAT